jgi:flagellin
MSVSIFDNLLSLRLASQMRVTGARFGAAIERAASGNRINRASDDPAGLSIAEKLRNDSRLMSVALRNATDAISATTVTDDALGEIANILSRMSELALRGANSTYSSEQRSAIQSEFVALGSEVDRISSGVSFNGNNLLSASSELIAQVGITADESSRIILPAVLGTLDSLGLGSGAALSYSVTGATTDYAVSASQTAYTAIQGALDDITQRRGTVGTTAARLNSAVSNLSVNRETTISAEAAIRNSDMASDMADVVRLRISREIQLSLFAQANQMMARVLVVLSP